MLLTMKSGSNVFLLVNTHSRRLTSLLFSSLSSTCCSLVIVSLPTGSCLGAHHWWRRMSKIFDLSLLMASSIEVSLLVLQENHLSDWKTFISDFIIMGCARNRSTLLSTDDDEDEDVCHRASLHIDLNEQRERRIMIRTSHCSHWSTRSDRGNDIGAVWVFTFPLVRSLKFCLSSLYPPPCKLNWSTCVFSKSVRPVSISEHVRVCCYLNCAVIGSDLRLKICWSSVVE